MKTFYRQKSHDEIQAQCKEQGLEFSDRKYREEGSDHITVKGGGGWVVYNCVSGRFIGEKPDGTPFSSDEQRDADPWFQQLLEFFYVPFKKPTARHG